MIYILSSKVDSSTQNIALWLEYYKKPRKILYTETQINDIRVTLFNEKIDIQLSTKFGEYSINLMEDRFFYRRGFLRADISAIISLKYFRSFFSNEVKTLSDFTEKFLFHHSTNIKTTKELNKLEVLAKASSLNLRFPQTIITSRKRDVINFSDHFDNKAIITKPIYEGLNMKLDEGYLMTYTSKISIKEIQDMDDFFLPTLFQEQINKWIEVRSFFLLGNFYSMAIFSQNDNQTDIDFRNYNYDKPNSVTSFVLPKRISSKLKKLFGILKVDTGSIDLCLTHQNEFVFLEINPVGQYDMVSEPCNYHLSREIAKNI
jgi:ATP-GRASP peptide maturase of grasp-with-spasm system